MDYYEKSYKSFNVRQSKNKSYSTNCINRPKNSRSEKDELNTSSLGTNSISRDYKSEDEDQFISASTLDDVHSILECVACSKLENSESEMDFSVSDDKYVSSPSPTPRLNRKYDVNKKLWDEDHETTHEELEKTNNKHKPEPKNANCNSSYYRAGF
ncbi:MAG: hypothetical protein sL5_09900 [Candidatus Mesenet longicola]|uniref:Uncharacterized protein n=1 Tax=Candidatus Mesenet longicola TaxID=1892558 RepID=A0A8J3MQW8_9RICK|nr:MAG: hypothetical protein sGL2_10540 [Candidatus Mesenet longicola]GHM59997.1 MAG: hypothetical protein sL5_09900 [Candidatus Mesenet longicola]